MYSLIAKVLKILLLIIIIFLLPTLIFFSTINKGVPNRDSGVYLYAGQQMNNGSIPYRDFWDHKPPGIFFINQIGLMLGNGNIIGVWFLEIVSILIAILFSYLFFKTTFKSDFIASLTTLFWFFSFLIVIEGGNLTEEYVLPFSFMALYIFSKAVKNNRNYLYFLLLGSISAVVFLLRQNLISIFVAIFIYFAIHNYKQKKIRLFFKQLVIAVAGFLIIIVPLIVYLIKHNALLETLNSVFVYNIIYSSGNNIFANAPNVAARGWYFFWKNRASLVLLLGALELYALVRFPIVNLNLKKIKYIIHFTFLYLPLELIFVSISGRTYPHYYINWVPLMSLLFSFVYYYYFKVKQTRGSVYINILTKSIFIYSVSFFILNTIRTYNFTYIRNSYLNLITHVRGYIRPQTDIEKYILSNSTEDDYLLMWGAETSINFTTRRKSPTKYVYQYPLFSTKYSSAARYEVFLKEIKQNKPLLIIDNISDSDGVVNIECNDRNNIELFIETLDGLEETLDYVCSNYQLHDKVSEKWFVYKHAIPENF